MKRMKNETSLNTNLNELEVFKFFNFEIRM